MIDGNGQDQGQSGVASDSPDTDAPGVGGGMDSSGGMGGTGEQSGAGYGNSAGYDDDGEQQQDQSVQRSETPSAEDVEFEADDVSIDDDDE